MNNLLSLKNQVKQLVKLFLPLVISFVFMGLMGITDTLVVGQYNTRELAYMGLATSIFIVLFTTPISLLEGVMIKASQHFGAKQFTSCGKVYNEGRKYLIYLSLVFMTIGFLSYYILPFFNQPPDVVEHTAPLIMMLSCSIPFILIFANANFFLQSIRRPHVAMIGIVVANVVNLGCDIIFVHGLFGLPAMGAFGASVTTLVVRVLLAIYMLLYIQKIKNNDKLCARFGLKNTCKTWWHDSKATRRLGFAVSLVVIASNGSMALVNILASQLGADNMASFVITINTMGFIFLIMFSLSQAVAILSARAYGKKAFDQLNTILLASYIVYFVIIGTLTGLIYLFPTAIFGVFMPNNELMPIILPLLGLLILDVIIDSSSLNLMALLRGQNDVKIPTFNQIFSFLGVRLLACVIFTSYFNLGLKGLLYGMMLGGAVSFILNLIRYIYVMCSNRKSII